MRMGNIEMTFKMITDPRSDWVLVDRSTEPDGKNREERGMDDGVKSTGAME